MSCPFAITQRRAEMGAGSVEVICPDDLSNGPNLEDKIVGLLDSCHQYNCVSSVDLKSVPVRGFEIPFTALCSPGEQQETLEMHQDGFQAETRTELLALAESQRAGVNLLLSDPNGPALRGF